MRLKNIQAQEETIISEEKSISPVSAREKRNAVYSVLYNTL